MILLLKYPVLPCEALPNYSTEKQVFFGDLHVHTHRSLDASLQGTLTTHQQTYDFARGGDLYLPHLATSLRLTTPLDFVAITDHAEFLGEVSICTHRENPGFNSLTCRLYRNIPSLAFYILNAQTAKKPRGTPPKVPRLAMCKGKDAVRRGSADLYGNASFKKRTSMILRAASLPSCL